MAEKERDTMMADVPELPPEPREELVSTAINFLLNAKVRPNPLSQKKAFLKRKGLTDEEIELAVDRSGTRNDPIVATPLVPYAQNQALATQTPLPAPVSGWSRTRDYLASAIILGGVSYGLYHFVKKVLYPYLFGPSMEEKCLLALQQSMTDLNTNVAQVLVVVQETQKSIQQQEDQIKNIIRDSSLNRGPDEMRLMQENRTVSEIKTEILSLKGLLLNRKQFPSTPIPKPVLPSWQLETTNLENTSSGDTPLTSDDKVNYNSLSMATDSQSQQNKVEGISAAADKKTQEQSPLVQSRIVEDEHASGNTPEKAESLQEDILATGEVLSEETCTDGHITENLSTNVIT